MRNLLEQLKQELKNRLSEDLYRTWFQPLQAEGECENSQWTLVANNDFAAMWIQDNYQDLLEQKVAQFVGHPVHLTFKALPMQESAVAPELPSVPFIPSETVPSRVCNGLSASYTFENFVVGANNQLAYAASVAVANAPGKAYNPLFIYGNTGLGKTHLMRAMGNFIHQHMASAKVMYLTTERFTNEFISALQENHLPSFRRKYRKADVLLIDDIHFLASKERIQEEFFHTFNELFESQKQIVLCSDRPAGEIAKLESRLVSRFQWGFVGDIQAPDFETRVAILTRKAQSMQLTLSPSVIEFLAQRVTRNVRRMEGALNRIAGYQKWMHVSDLSLHKVEELLYDIFQEELASQVTIEDIQKQICDFYHITMTDLLGKKRPNAIAFPRQVGMYLCRILTQSSLEEIGIAFGGRDHGTVIHACKTVENTLQQEPTTQRTLQFLQQKLVRKN
ncbi:MAG: chromosomal replication initiator protein DnaA [Opitutales bacterium]|nr:chromosomal replication initiator protein DnaA [Opitutales bacterium]